MIDGDQYPQAPGYGPGWSMGGWVGGPKMNFSQIRELDNAMRQLGVNDRVTGLAVIRASRRPGRCPVGIIAAHEAAHLVGLSYVGGTRRYFNSAPEMTPITLLQAMYGCPTSDRYF